jgi:hypothetical protein
VRIDDLVAPWFVTTIPMEIRAADARGADFDQHLAWMEFRLRDIFHPDIAFAMKNRCTHGFAPCIPKRRM